MNKKLFALMIASSILAQPIIAQEAQKTPHEAALDRAESRGFKNGIAATLAASSIAMMLYIQTTLKQGLFIPAGINCRSVPDGYRMIFPTCSPDNIFCSRFPISEPKFKTVCDENPLFNAMRDASGEISLHGISINKENMIEKIGAFPNKVAYVCAATLVGVFIYYLSLDYKPKQPADAAKPNSLEQHTAIAEEKHNPHETQKIAHNLTAKTQ